MIKAFDKVRINGQEAVVKEVSDEGLTLYPKAIVIIDGIEYSVGIQDIETDKGNK